MKLITLNCPNCGGQTEFDNNKEFGFCQHCGSKIMIKDETININVTNLANLNNLLRLMKTNMGTNKCDKYLDKILELDPDNFYAIAAKSSHLISGNPLTPKLYYERFINSDKLDRKIKLEISSFRNINIKTMYLALVSLGFTLISVFYNILNPYSSFSWLFIFIGTFFIFGSISIFYANKYEKIIKKIILDGVK